MKASFSDIAKVTLSFCLRDVQLNKIYLYEASYLEITLKGSLLHRSHILALMFRFKGITATVNQQLKPKLFLWLTPF